MLFMILGFVLHAALVWAALEFIETQWPTLHRAIRALLITTVITIVITILHRWICGWLC